MLSWGRGGGGGFKGNLQPEIPCELKKEENSVHDKYIRHPSRALNT